MLKRITLFTAVLALALLASDRFESGKALAAKASAVLQHCSNSFYGNVQPCSGGAWIPGVLDATTSDYKEGDSVPYRVLLDGYNPGTTHTITIEWDSTRGAAHAIDYLTSFDRTLTLASGNLPCDVLSTCGTFTTFPIPADFQVTGAGVTPAPGAFTLFGGTITSVSGYSYTGPQGKRSTSITLTFTADSGKMVLAWGAHLATDSDWGDKGGSASDVANAIQTRILSASFKSGSQSRSITAVKPEPPRTKIVIIAQSNIESSQPFDFSTTANGESTFTLFDDGNDNDATPTNATFFVAPGPYNFTQTGNGIYDLISINCSQNVGGTSNWSPSIPGSLVNITVNAGDTVTCTFFNAYVPPTLP